MNNTEMPSEELRFLPNDEKGRYMERFLESLLSKNKERGLTLSEIIKLSDISKPTIIKYLEILFSKRKIYRERKGNMTIYYPNGRVSHPSEEGGIEFEDRKYKFSIVNYGSDKFLYIQEKGMDENGFEEIIGGIMFPFGKKQITDFINQLKKIEQSQKKSKVED